MVNSVVVSYMSLFCLFGFFISTMGIYCTFITGKYFSTILDKQNYKNEEREGRRKEGKKEKKTSLEKSIIWVAAVIILSIILF